MFFYTVNEGDSLFLIGQRYNISVEDLRRVNGLTTGNIVPGLALLIPLDIYTVQPGDTLTQIARRSFVTLDELMATNPSVNSHSLHQGTQIKIPNISKFVSSLSYYVVRNPELDRLLIDDFAPYSSYIAIFEYRFGPNGDIITELNDLDAIEETWNNRVMPLATITNLVPEGFSTELVHQVLNNPTARTNLINNIYYLVASKGYGGINIDFEQVSSEDRDLLTGFLSQLKRRLESGGYLLTIAVPAKTSDDIPWVQGYDYAGIGAVVDLMFIMAYDWHYAQSEPGPVAPINDVQKTIEYTMSRLPRNKIILGVPLYGYDWTIPYEFGTVASALSNQQALDRAVLYGVPIHYSEEFATPYFRYTDEQGQHEVWFEDVRSMGEKMKLVYDYGLHGIGAWQLTLGFTAGPWIFTKFFTARKV